MSRTLPDPLPEVALAVERLVEEASFADGPEEALWTFTRAVPSLFGRENEVYGRADAAGVEVMTACTAFLLTPDRRFHLITAPVNFLPEQYHEKVSIDLGHPAHVARTRHPLLLKNTAHHTSFVKILQTFRAGSSMFAPLLWAGDYLGVLIAASTRHESFREADLLGLRVMAAAATATFIAKGGPAWLEGLDLSGLPERHHGT